jgi:uncharacterized protein (TIGR02996 family)
MVTDVEARQTAFLKEIAAHPTDDTLRLIYADWIEENVIGPASDKRTTLIRLQVQAATLPANDPNKIALEKEAKTILDKHGQEWTQHLASLGATEIKWERGFPSSAALTDVAFHSHGEEITATGLTNLTISIGDAGVQALAASPTLKKLTHLNLEGNNIGPEGAQVIAASTTLTELTDLNLEGNNIGDAGAQALADSPNLKKVTDLNLRGNDIGNTGVQALAASPNLKKVTDLNLALNNIGDEGAQVIAASTTLTELTDLNLRGNDIGNTGAQALADSPNLKKVTDLNLRGNDIGDAGAQALAASTTLTELTDLNLEGNNIGDNMFAQLQRAMERRRTSQEGHGTPG